MILPPTLPFTPHHTIQILDSTKIRSYMQCPRDYLFRYCFGWVPELPNIHLVTGISWHEAMEHLLNTNYSSPNVDIAYNLFMETWLKEMGSLETGQLITQGKSKTPEHLHLILKDYASHWHRDHERYEVIATEVACEVPIREDQTYVGKLDAILRDRKDSLLLDFEHKTGSRLTDGWKNKWNNSLQMQGYDYLLWTSFPTETKGSLVNGAIIGMPTLKEPLNWKPIRVLVRKEDSMRHAWLLNINYWLARIEQDFQLLSSETSSNKVMFSFPCNSEACEHRFGCDFSSICPYVPNPLQLYEELEGEAPPGYIKKFWNPKAHGKTLLKNGEFSPKEPLLLPEDETSSEPIITGKPIRP